MTGVPQQLNTLTIDGRELEAAADQTILEVARAHGIPIPTLCSAPGITETSACRLCLVEVKGVGRLLPACRTQARPGMEIVAHSARLHQYRRTLVELLLTERTHDCAACASAGHCELETLAHDFGIDKPSLPYLRFPTAIDESSPCYVLDHRRCILCTRCVRVCAEIEGVHTLDIAGRGLESRLIIDLDEPWSESKTCTACGKCIACCPTGALTSKRKEMSV
jgi:bidirectional [NiFe] hydrogenase diaphorase subunit